MVSVHVEEASTFNLKTFAPLLRRGGWLEFGRADLEVDTCTPEDVSLPALLSGRLSCCFMVRSRESNKAMVEVTGRKDSLVVVDSCIFELFWLLGLKDMAVFVR